MFYLLATPHLLNTISKKILEVQDVANITPDLAMLEVIPKDTANKVQTLVFDKDEQVLHIITTNNFSEELRNLVQKLKEQGYGCELYYTDKQGIDVALARYDKKQQIESEQQHAATQQQEASGQDAVGMIKSVFEKKDSMDPGEFILEMVRLTFQAGSSDLHFQPEEKGVFMKARIDGVLRDIVSFGHDDFLKYLQKLKFIAGTKMNIDYIPQDGRFSFEASDGKWGIKKIDVRANFMPGTISESTVLRFLDSSSSIQSFENIWFWGDGYDTFKRGLQQNFGMILITGPTGSGKTTTLYSVLDSKNNGNEKIITLEDPIEYQLPGVQQSQINYAKGYDYLQGLKACMRHDPDIILVWETRTLETAEISISAALTGHLVFTTLHTNSAVEAITRILSMGVKPYMLAPALIMIQAQRLVRKICPHCTVTREASYTEKTQLQEAYEKINNIRPELNIQFNGQVPYGSGCEQCNWSWYKGRIAVLEVLEVTNKLKEMIVSGASTGEIFTAARNNKFLTLQEDAYIKLSRGLTTIEEIRRVV